jgi:hypothetical protein
LRKIKLAIPQLDADTFLAESKKFCSTTTSNAKFGQAKSVLKWIAEILGIEKLELNN